MAFDFASLENFKPKRKRGGQKKYNLQSKRLEIAMMYYRYFYVDGETRQTAIKKIEDEYRPRISLTTIKNALAYYDERTSKGQERLRSSMASSIYCYYKILADIISSYGLKPLPDWITCWQTPKPYPKVD